MGPQQGSKKQNKAARNEKMAAARQRVAQQREREAKATRRRSIIIGSTAAVVAIGVIGGLAAIVMTDEGGGSTGSDLIAEVAAAPNLASPIAGVSGYTASRDHEPNRNIIYQQVPPVGGQHHDVWQNCGIYSKPLESKHAVHSLEHGAVWITYNPTLPADQVDKLKAKAKQDYMLLSPFEGMSTPITVTSWGFQLKVDNADDPRIDQFITTYRNNKDTTPEYGAACTGGTGKPS